MVKSTHQKKIDLIFYQVVKSQLSESMARLTQGKLLKSAQEMCAKHGYSFSYNCRRHKVEPKKARALIAIYDAYQGKTVTIGQIQDLGWHKMMVVAPKLGQGMDSYWIEKAMKTNLPTLKAQVGNVKASRVSSVSFQLTSEERAELYACLEMFGAKKNVRGLNKRDFALMQMTKAAAKTVKPKLALVV